MALAVAVQNKIDQIDVQLIQKFFLWTKKKAVISFNRIPQIAMQQ